MCLNSFEPRVEYANFSSSACTNAGELSQSHLFSCTMNKMTFFLLITLPISIFVVQSKLSTPTVLPFEVQLFSKHFVPLCSKKCAKAVQYFQNVTLLCYILSNRNREKDRKQTKPWVAPLSNKQEDWMILIYFMELSPPFAHRPVSRKFQ